MLIGIPHYNNVEGLKMCVNSFLAYTEYRDIELVIANADRKATKEIQDYLKGFEKEFKVVQLEIENVNPLHAYNILFNYARDKKEGILLTQTDVYFPKTVKDWIHGLLALIKLPDAGQITCWGGGGISGTDFLDGFPWVGAWFNYVTYTALQKVGNYDNAIPIGWGVDVDYSYGVFKVGLKNYIFDYWVQHMPNYKEGHDWEKRNDIEKIKKEAYKYMRTKWNLGD